MEIDYKTNLFSEFLLFDFPLNHSVYFLNVYLRVITKTATAKELRYRTSLIPWKCRKGMEFIITMRGKSIAISEASKKERRRDLTLLDLVYGKTEKT